ncbi:MlaD family protein [Antrihabitans sp. NCIMB 15449]|uniref:MlaD family protein n=1 Tax=Antrihabitans spumae TaxID=3373370 RepID=A0ABW7JND8_9NOCA
MNSPLLRFLVRKHIAVANLSLVVILLLSGGFLLVYIMRVNPLKDTYDVTVEMSASGGLMPNSDVTYRGYRVGTIRSVDLSKDGVVAVAEIESWARIADSGDVAVHRLSAASASSTSTSGPIRLRDPTFRTVPSSIRRR